MDIKYNLKSASERRTEPFKPEGDVGFGKLRTDHMFLMDYRDGQWCDPRIVPYGPFEMAPGAMSLHYGQSIFEGAKAFMHEDGEIYTFRLNKNAERMNRSADIVCIPNIDEAMQVKAINALIDADRLWFPQQEGACLYIRPFIFATEDRLSVSPSQQYTFCVMLSPSGAYYASGVNNGIRLLISTKYHRAVSGGTGASKASGNYAASLRAGKAAAEHGASQVLYLDSTNTQIEEAGAMNHFHILKDGTVIIPTFTDTILKSITSQSIMELGDMLGCEVRQETVMLDKFIADIEAGEIIEAGGFGTAAVVSPVSSYIFEDGRIVTVGDGKVGPNIKRIYKLFTELQKGHVAAPQGWVKRVERVAP
ncbi:branched-chain amino acid aminotransferase [Shewanella ulleungensis]|jgi:branched-chain amino acid aminotransferase|uniref:Branched-chain-amino-acid aminotransferase n=1 Tax=Shewanella ulleungensis TaxID=2282699 RepID=A0ABQ2QX52_9GAMM|nr:branched-chain amino acid aminotransferase [Shewanella ulleungensis]MCL1152303.1 branched-chain amino acid aminotransferase [Shewanella ulleungensis]GGQ00830.1 branched chain amino acid aminotransferase [Shewanella ulleungensis]